MGFPYYTLFISAVVNSFLSSFQYGYHMSVINIPETILISFTNESHQKHYGTYMDNFGLQWLWIFIASAFTIGEIIGSIISAYMAERFGRRISLFVLNNILAVVGNGLLALALPVWSLELLVIGRLLAGINTGISSILPVYLNECSPTRYRGFVGSFQNLSICASTFLADLLALPLLLGTRDLMPYLLGLGLFPALLQILLTPCYPETPKYLLLNKNNVEKARKSVRYYYGPRFDANAILREFQQEQATEVKQLGFLEILKDKDLRQPTILSIVVNIGQPITGISAIMTFSTQMFMAAGLDESAADYCTVFMATINLLASMAAPLLVDRFGRRPLLLVCLVWDIVCCIIFLLFSQIGMSFDAQWATYVSLIAVVIHIAAYNIGPGSVSFFISSEVLPQHARSAGTAVGNATGFVVALILTILFAPLQRAVGTYCFLLFIIPCTAVTLWLYFKMPETRGKTVDEIMLTWKKQKPTKVNIAGYETFEDDESILED